MTENHYGASCDQESSTPVIVIHPGRMGGQATIGHSRLPALTVADHYWYHGIEEVRAMWDYLTDIDVLVCCWFAARYGTYKKRKRWGWAEWLLEADWSLWSVHTMGECPWPPRKENSDA